MNILIFLNKKWSVFGLLFFNLALAGCKDEGVLATPIINPHPKEVTRIRVRVLHIPNYDFKYSPEDALTARWESNALACSIIRHGYGGSVITPKYEIKLKRNLSGEFNLNPDLIEKDKCNWKLTGVFYSYSDGEINLARFGLAAEQLFSEKSWLFSCEFGRPDEKKTYPNGLVIEKSGGVCMDADSPQVKVSPSFNSLFEIAKED